MIILVSMQSECLSLSNGASYSKSQKCDLRLVLSRWITYKSVIRTLHVCIKVFFVVLTYTCSRSTVYTDIIYTHMCTYMAEQILFYTGCCIISSTDLPVHLVFISLVVFCHCSTDPPFDRCQKTPEFRSFHQN